MLFYPLLVAMRYVRILFHNRQSIKSYAQIKFDIQKVANPDEVSGPFLLYNAVRFKSLFRKFDAGVASGEYPPLPPLEEIDFSLLNEQVCNCEYM